jgi:hypothetical protein
VFGDLDSCVMRWFKKVVKGETVVVASLNSKFWRVDIGTKCIGDGEGRIKRLLRSKSWQKIAAVFEDDPVVCDVLLSDEKISKKTF